MRGLRTATRAGAAALATLALAGCANDVPTATGRDLFPAGTEMSTIALDLPTDRFLSADTVFDGFSSVQSAAYLLVANQFDGALDAHALVRFGGFPDSVAYTPTGGTLTVDKAFTYGTGRVTAVIDTIASVPPSGVTLQLYALEQPFDNASATWQNASEANGAVVPWRTPGGTLGSLISQATWVRGDTLTRDTVVWQVDSVAMKRIAAPGFPGLAVVVAQPGARVQLTGPNVVAKVHPSAHPDTTVTVTPSTFGLTFVFNPPVPQPGGIFRLGGVTGARVVMRLNLDQQVPTCAPPATGCPTVPLREVTLNRAVLLLDALPVPSGFRPTIPHFIQVREVLEPDLGRLSSLGTVLAQDSVAPALFQSPGGQTASVVLTGVLQTFADSSAVNLALLSSTRTPSFGTLWFTSTPRLRLVYTLPQTPKLP